MAVVEPYAEQPEAQSAHDAELVTNAYAPSPSSVEEEAPGPPPPGRWLYSDKNLDPTDADSPNPLDALSLGAYADALALLMDWKETSTPLTIAINGPWGSGKTSLAKMAEARLPIGSDWDAPHVICWFDAWANDDAPHLGAAFAAAVAKEANKRRRWWVRLVMPLPSAMLSPEQRWWRRLWLVVLAVVLAAAAVFWPTGSSLLSPFLHPGATVDTLGHGATAARLAWPALIVAIIVMAQKLTPSIQGVARWIDDPGSEAARGSMQEANQQLRRLIKQALRDKRRFMIFVDNLERCRPPRAVEVCEVVSQLIGHPQVVTVLIGDMDTIALSAEIKYAALESLAPEYGGVSGSVPAGARKPVGSYGRAYLEKLIQIQLRLPPPLPKGLRDMLVPVAGERPAFPAQISDSRRRFEWAMSPKTFTSRVSRFSIYVLGGAVTTFAVTIGIYLLSGQASGLLKHVASSTWTAVVTGGIGVVTALWQVASDALQRMRKERKRNQLDDAVKTEIEPTEMVVRPDAVNKLAQQVGNIEEGDVRRRLRQRIISNNDLRAELDRAVLDVLPLSPRAAKRMFNHAHLLLDIGVERGIFASNPGLTAGQLAAWVALNERWPSVAACITRDPTLVGRLEDVARQTALVAGPEQLAKLENEIGITGLDAELLDYLRRTDSLVRVVRLLVNFSPDSDETLATA